MKRFFISLLLVFSPLFGGTLVQRQSTGLLLREDFSAPTGWSGGGFFSTGLNPSYVMFGALPLVTMSRTAGGIDSQGCRESSMLVDGNWRDLSTPRRLFYGSSAAGVTGWRPNYALSTNAGVSWTKLGGWGPGLSNGTGGTYPGRDLLQVEHRGSLYIVHAMIGRDNLVDADGTVPLPPYTSDVWTIADISQWTTSGAFTYMGDSVVVGGGGTFDEKSAYESCIVRDQFGGYVLFYSSTNSDQSVLNVGISDSTPLGSPTGPFTKRLTAGVLPESDNYGENPKVFWSEALQKWVMLQDKAYVPGFNAFEYLWLGDKLRDWSAATSLQIMRVCPNDGPKRIGLAGPYYLPEGAIIETPDGYVPITYDNDGRDMIDSTGNNIWCKIVSGVLEPSRYALSYDPTGTSTTVFSDNFDRSNRNLDGDNGWVQGTGSSGSITILSNHVDLNDNIGNRSVYNTTASIGNGSVQADLTLTGTPGDGGPGIGIISSAANASNYYFTDFFINPSFPTILHISPWKRIGGTETQISDNSVTWAVPLGTAFTVKCVYSNGGQTNDVYINGVHQITINFDSSLSGTGYVGLRNGGPASGDHRYVDNLVVQVTGSRDTSVQTYRKTFSNADFIAEYAVSFAESIGSSFHGFDYRVQSGGDCYRLKLTNGGGLVLQKSTGGTFSTLASSSGTLTGITKASHRIKISVQGNVHTCWLDGEQQITYTDSSSPYTSGTSIGFAAQTIRQTVRLLSMRTSDTVTVNGLSAGQVVTLRAPGTPPVATVTASGSSVTFTPTHYPAGSIDVDGVDNQVLGGIWGGDTFTVPGGGAGSRGFSF